jgi:hypothetical protein
VIKKYKEEINMCYTVPLTAALVTSIVSSKKKNPKLGWLNLMLWGGAFFGAIDHLWNGELFLISPNIISDLLLGLTITLSIVLVWLVMLKVSDTRSVLGEVNIRR